jgi:hypothetical protein
MTEREISMWTYPWDLVDTGVDRARGTLEERAGVTGVNVAAIYHAGKFLHVHNPQRKMVFPESGTLYFPPDDAWHGKLRLEPPVWEVAEQRDVWGELRAAASSRDLEVTAWVLGLHNSGLGTRHPDCTVRNVFGDRMVTDLCANHPDVREYAVAAIGDVARSLPVDRVLVESLEYMPFRHGFHHEVIGVPTGPTIDLLMVLCFCEHCTRAASAAGVDTEAVAAWVRTTVEDHLADPFAGTPELSWEELRGAADGELGGYLDARQEAVCSLIEEVADAVRSDSDARFAVLDFGPLYANGPDGRAWESGLDLERAVRVADEVHPTFYFTDADVHRAKVEEYVGLLDGAVPMVAALRAILPQTSSADDLLAQVRPLAPHAAGLSFYNYGFMALQTLDWIATATRTIAAEERS